jgi:hypothetical protein
VPGAGFGDPNWRLVVATPPPSVTGAASLNDSQAGDPAAENVTTAPETGFPLFVTVTLNGALVDRLVAVKAPPPGVVALRTSPLAANAGAAVAIVIAGTDHAAP